MPQKKQINQDRIFIGLGSNVGDPLYQLFTAVRLINKKAGAIVHTSSIYETEAWGKVDQEIFLNMVIEIQSNLSPFHLLYELQKIERQLKKGKKALWGPRRIDLDIIYYGDKIIEESQLIIPHPNMYLRNFVLVPLNEIAPEFVHPVFNVRSDELLEKCEDELNVKHFTRGDENWEYV